MIRVRLLMILAFIILAFTGCGEKGCTVPGSDNYDPDATVSSNNCIPARDKFLGDYSVQANCTDTVYAYNMSIATVVNGVQNVNIQNFGDYNFAVNATVSGSVITITTGTYNNTTVSGSGEISGYTLVLHYLAINAVTHDTASCNITAVKQ